MRRAAIGVMAVVLALAVPTPANRAFAQMSMPSSMVSPSGSDRPTHTEAAFIARVAKTLLAAYPTAAAARKAGYIQTTGIDEDGTAIFFNRDFTHVDPLHPNFLWYDRNDRLVGLDYELPQSAYASPPTAGYPVGAARWTVVHEHVHLGYRVGSGPVMMHGARALPNLRTEPITAEALRADHVLPEGATLLWAYYHPACWDLGFWLIPNANGAFAEMNPSVR